MSHYIIERGDVVKRVIRDHISAIQAERLATEWEYEANRRGLDTRRSEFWRAGRLWIDAEALTRE